MQGINGITFIVLSMERIYLSIEQMLNETSIFHSDIELYHKQ